MIHVINDFVVTSDGTQYIMGRLAKSKKKDGTEVEYIRQPHYYSTLSSALMGISRLMRAEAVKDTKGTLEDLYEAIKRSDNELLRAFSKVDGVVVREAYKESE